MKNNSAAILIPARLNSSRFPRKVLAPIAGKPLIIHVLENAKKLGLCECYVACCSKEIKDIVQQYGGNAILTDPDLPSGSDRIFAALETLDSKPEYVINLQGDNPVFDSSILSDLLDLLEKNQEIDIATPVVFHGSLDEFDNLNLVKVVFDGMQEKQPGKVLYFSRAPIPHFAKSFYSHIGIYAYRYKSLGRFIHTPQSFLETTEKLEQLRALEIGMSIWALPVTGGSFLSVDIREDLVEVEKYLLS